MTTAEMPEPADGTALYWPGDADIIASLLIRDDSSADLNGEPAARWWVANTADPGMTWPDAVVWMGGQDLDLDQAVPLTLARPTPVGSWYEAAPNRWVLFDTRVGDPWSSAIAKVHLVVDSALAGQWAACRYLRDDDEYGRYPLLSNAWRAAETAVLGAPDAAVTR